MTKLACLAFALALAAGCATAQAKKAQETPAPKPPAQVKPKYGPEITLLRDAPDHIRKAKAPDYWALSPYYVGTPGECACSTALSIVVNGARIRRKLTSEEKLATPGELVKSVRIPDFDWRKRIDEGKGITLDEVPRVLSHALRQYGVNNFTIDVVRPEGATVEARKRLRYELENNEGTDRNFIIANFNQGVYTGDADAGHIAVVGAYDAKRRKVLILDTDREWYEPYWVSEETFLAGMLKPDPETKQNRGYVKVFISE
jgi:hypothetical protein